MQASSRTADISSVPVRSTRPSRMGVRVFTQPGSIADIPNVWTFPFPPIERTA